MQYPSPLDKVRHMQDTASDFGPLASFWLPSATSPLKPETQSRERLLDRVFDRDRPVTPSTESSPRGGSGRDGGTPLRTKENTVSMAPSNNGFLLLDAGLNLVASNDPALQILCFPSRGDRIKQPKVFLADRVRTVLLDHQHQGGPAFVKELKSGKRRYICKSFQVDCNVRDFVQPVVAVLLERDAGGSMMLTEISQQFDLTQRERETVEFLLQGLTSKEIATRMKISPNTVKAFLRLVMVKMKVSTRSGIAGKIAGARPNA
jgi:DNA-binding CsgD family transcriptional regulator